MSATVSIPPEREGRAASPDLAERREQMGTAVASGVFATKQPAVETTFDGKRTLRFAPGSEARGWMLQLHGGGFRIGRPEFEGPLAEALAARCGIEVVVPQYRLSPEGPFPAGLNDALSALKALRSQIGDAPLIVGGDSAGGGLAAALGVLSAHGMAPRIDALVLLSPWLDLTVSAPAYAENADDPMFSKEQADIAAELYLQGFDATHPLASPLLARVSSFPPTLISVGTGEVLRDDSLRFHEKLLAAGVQSELSGIDGMEHVAVVRSMELTGAAQTFEAIAVFVDGILER
ncbi:MAG: alpha/beta hydrolase [Novosphingobium sp.]